MVGYYAQGNILFRVITVFYTGNAADMLHYVLHRIYKKQVVYILHNTGKALKAHARIYIRMRHRRIVAVAVAVKLRENNIPELDVAVAVAAYTARRLVAAVLRSAVEVYLRAWAARARTMLPKIILSAKAHYVRRINANFFCPDVKSLIVIFVNRHPEPVGWKLKHFRAELPCPRRSLVLEIIAERKVAEHFKKSAMAVGYANVVDIASAYTFLACCHALARRRHFTCEIFFHRRHSRINQQKAVVIFRDKRKARQPHMAFRFEKRKVFFPQLIKTCPFHIILYPISA